jgi:hypothetical protein
MIFARRPSASVSKLSTTPAGNGRRRSALLEPRHAIAESCRRSSSATARSAKRDPARLGTFGLADEPIFGCVDLFGRGRDR